jgi:hypothetical protein
VDDEEEQQVRRSTRQKAHPYWMKSGDFVQSVQIGTPDPWNPKEKIQYLQSILITDSCKGYKSKIIDTMLDYSEAMMLILFTDIYFWIMIIRFVM